MNLKRDYAPLSAACVGALTDKVNDKRKAAAVEIEKMVKEFVAHNHSTKLRRLLKVLGQDFAMSKNPCIKKGGLIGLAAIAIGLGKESKNYIDELVVPILVNLNDSDLKIRYYACESLCNVSKVALENVLKHFPEIFKSLSKLVTDLDENVKNASEYLNSIMKDIAKNNPCALDHNELIPVLRDGIYKDNPLAKKFIISWILVLNYISSIDLVIHLLEMLDGLFKMLFDTTFEIKQMCDAAMKKFLEELHKNSEKVEYTDMINTVVIYSYSSDEYYTAMYWLKELIEIYGLRILPFTPSILTTLLVLNSNQEIESKMLIKQIANLVNSRLIMIIKEVHDTKEDTQGLDLVSVITVLTKDFDGLKVKTKIMVLKWIYNLFIKFPQKILACVEIIFPLLMVILSYPNEEVIQYDLKVIALIISPPPAETINKQYFNSFIISLLKQCISNEEFMKDHGKLVIRQTCSLLNSKDIYCALSKFLLEEENMIFVSVMTGMLNTILLTSSELCDLRTQLRDVKKKENHDIFLCLFRTWCHNPVATVALCLFTQHYFFVYKLLKTLTSMDITVDLLIELDKLIQILESPVFIRNFIKLENGAVNQYLIQSLYGLLMIMPQSNSFNLLQQRLNCISHLNIGSEISSSKIVESSFKGVFNINMMLQHFTKMQEKQRIYRRITSFNSDNTTDHIFFT